MVETGEKEGESEEKRGITMALITAVEARVYLRGLTGTAEDTTIDTMIARVSALFGSYCGFPTETGVATMESATYVHYLEGPGGYSLRLPVWPVSSVTSIYDDSGRAYASADLVSSGDYDVIGDFGLVIAKSTGNHTAWGTGGRAIKATYVAGFATVPADVKHACGLQVAHIWRHRDSIGDSSVSKAGGSASPLPLSLLPEVKAALRPYRLAGDWIG
jgi:hypothetical protein